MTDTSAITNRSAFVRGSLGIQIVLAIVTLGLYTIYWMYKLHKQLDAGTEADVSVGLRTLGYLIPFVYFVVVWKTSHDVEPITEKDGILLFLLFVVFPPAAWFLIQSGINGIAE